MSFLVYQFEAVSIQNYIFSSSKLKEMVQGSQLLEALTGEILDAILQAQDLVQGAGKDVTFARRAGGVFLAIFKPSERAEVFIQTWPLLVQQIIPGLNFSASAGSGDDIAQVIKEVRQDLDQQKNAPKVTLPEISPIAQRNQRSGEAVVEVKKERKNDLLLDAISLPKYKTQYQGEAVFQKTFDKWKPEGHPNVMFPTCFDHSGQGECDSTEAFPFKKSDPGHHTVAVIHADGNGMGQYIKGFMESIQNEDNFVAKYAQFSQLLEDSTKEAAQSAVEWLIKAHGSNETLPMRPLILSGDDVAVIVRADYAIGFVKAMTLAFERASQKRLKELGSDQFPNKLTLTSGMVFLRSNQPFYMAYHLAEDLCSNAKKKGVEMKLTDGKKPVFPSLTSFLLISNTLFDDAETQIEQEFTVQIGGKKKQLTAIPYRFNEDAKGKAPALEALESVANCFVTAETQEGLKVSFLRELATYLHSDPSHAQRMLERWQTLNASQAQKVNERLQAGFDVTLQDLVTGDKAVPLADIILWHSVETTCKAEGEAS